MNAKLKLSTRILLGYVVPCVVFTLAVVAVYLESLGLERTIAQMNRAVSIVENAQALQLHVAELLARSSNVPFVQYRNVPFW